MSNSQVSGFAAALAEAATSVNAPRTVAERLRAVVEAAAGAIPGFDGVSITLGAGPGEVETRAASSEAVEALDLIQYESEEGPCFEALSRAGVVVAPSVRHEQRWPRY